jgi:cytoskeletal protein CcmA (bactofilin family)
MNTPQPSAPNSATPRNVLAGDVKITGTLKFTHELTFDGALDGEILSEGALTIGRSSDVKGEVRTKTVVLYGTVTGNITVADRCELKTGSTLQGDLKACRILVEEGATFIGKSEVTTRKVEPKIEPKAEPTKGAKPAPGPVAAARS